VFNLFEKQWLIKEYNYSNLNNYMWLTLKGDDVRNYNIVLPENLVNINIWRDDLKNKSFPENINKNLELEIIKALDSWKLERTIKNYDFINFYLDDWELSWTEGEEENF
jgi:hypothetical protein